MKKESVFLLIVATLILVLVPTHSKSEEANVTFKVHCINNGQETIATAHFNAKFENGIVTGSNYTRGRVGDCDTGSGKGFSMARFVLQGDTFTVTGEGSDPDCSYTRQKEKVKFNDDEARFLAHLAEQGNLVDQFVIIFSLKELADALELDPRDKETLIVLLGKTLEPPTRGWGEAMKDVNTIIRQQGAKDIEYFQQGKFSKVDSLYGKKPQPHNRKYFERLSRAYQNGAEEPNDEGTIYGTWIGPTVSAPEIGYSTWAEVIINRKE